MSREALFQARVAKREIEEELNAKLQEFTESTGLAITSIDVTTINVSSLSHEPLANIYRCDLDIRVLSDQSF